MEIDFQLLMAWQRERKENHEIWLVFRDFGPLRLVEIESSIVIDDPSARSVPISRLKRPTLAILRGMKVTTCPWNWREWKWISTKRHSCQIKPHCWICHSPCVLYGFKAHLAQFFHRWFQPDISVKDYKSRKGGAEFSIMKDRGWFYSHYFRSFDEWKGNFREKKKSQVAIAWPDLPQLRWFWHLLPRKIKGELGRFIDPALTSDLLMKWNDLWGQNRGKQCDRCRQSPLEARLRAPSTWWLKNIWQFRNWGGKCF